MLGAPRCFVELKLIWWCAACERCIWLFVDLGGVSELAVYSASWFKAVISTFVMCLVVLGSAITKQHASFAWSWLTCIQVWSCCAVPGQPPPAEQHSWGSTLARGTLTLPFLQVEPTRLPSFSEFSTF